jgi:hypothetical protein
MFKTERIDEYVLQLDAGKVGASGWEHKTLAMFDQHFDSDKCRKDLFEGGLRAAKDGGHPVLFGGDMMDVMQTRSDPRRSRGGNMSDNMRYLNNLIDELAEFLLPYTENIIAWFDGNHETAILKNCDLDLVEAVIGKLRDKTGYAINHMNYSGYILYRMKFSSSNYGSPKVWVHHGYGGNAQVTKGVNHVMYRASSYPDADVFLTGHTHNCWTMPHAQEKVSDGGKVYKRVQWHAQIPSLKDETKAKKGRGWGIEKGFTPQVNGYGWVNFQRVPCTNKQLVIPTQPTLVLEHN